MWDSKRYNKLDIFYEIAIELDNKFYKKKIEKNPKSILPTRIRKIFQNKKFL